jgi:hypothetical protein
MRKILLEPLEILHALRRSPRPRLHARPTSGTSSWKWSSFWTCSASSASECPTKSPTRHGQITRTRYNVNSGFAGPNRFQSLLGPAVLVGEFFGIPVPKDRILGADVHPSVEFLPVHIPFDHLYAAIPLLIEQLSIRSNDLG